MNAEKTLYDHFCDDDVYEYVRYLAVKYYPEYADQPDGYGFTIPPIDALLKVNAVEETTEQDEPEIIGCERGFTLFQRIQEGKALFLFSKEDYLANRPILDSVIAVGLDPEKFWQAILFIHHMAEMENTDCKPMRPSVHDNVQELIGALRDDQTIVKIKRRGKKEYIMDDKATKVIIGYFLTYCDHLYDNPDNPSYTGHTYLLDQDFVDQGLNWQMYDEYRAYKDIFEKYCTDKDQPKRTKGRKASRDKDLLISRILFMTKVTDDQAFWEKKDRIHAIKRYCESNRRPPKDSGLYW